jgi:hypothetical protein
MNTDTQLELKWLIKTYETTTNKAKFFNPFLQNWPEHENSNNKLKTESQKLTLESWETGLEKFKK